MDPALLLLLLSVLVPAQSAVPSSAVCAHVEALEAEYLSLLQPPNSQHWTPPVLAPTSAGFRFEWRLTTTITDNGCEPRGSRSVTDAWWMTPHQGNTVARNVSQVSATLTLTAVDHPNYPLVRCEQHSNTSSMICGAGADLPANAAHIRVNLTVTLSAIGPKGPVRATTEAYGVFIQGLDSTSSAWGGAEWIGLPKANDTATQFVAVGNLHELGFASSSDVARAVLFVSGLGGYRAAINGRPLDPTAIRGSVTEWHNRTYYFGDDITSDITAAADINGSVVVAIELFKHWYALANNFYPIPYGPRSLKAVVLLTRPNGSDTFFLPTSSSASAAWRHGSGAAVFDDLHGGQIVDGRLATPGWENNSEVGVDVTDSTWSVPTSIATPPGRLLPHPMPRSRVLELVTPTNVTKVSGATCANSQPSPGVTYRFTLPYEIAGFCTVLLPRGSPPGASILVKHGEAVDPKTNFLCQVHGVPGVQEYTNYTCRGNSLGMGVHDIAWRRLAVGGNVTYSVKDESDLEAFTPAFQYSAFSFVDVSYKGFPSSTETPQSLSLVCYRIGVGFDWIGDIVVAPPDSSKSNGTTPADRFNIVIAAGRSTGISNYVMDITTDSPSKEKRGWMGDSLAAHRNLAAHFDMRASYIKWVEDMVLMSSNMWGPRGTISNMVPCVFGSCADDPRNPNRSQANSYTDLAWGSAMPLIGSFIAEITGDFRFATRVAPSISDFASILHSFANTASSEFPQLLHCSDNDTDISGWPNSCYGDWFPVAASAASTSVNTLLDTHFYILDTVAASSLIRLAKRNNLSCWNCEHDQDPRPTEEELNDWAATARASFSRAFLRNISVNVSFIPEGMNDTVPPISGLAFHDPVVSTLTHHGTLNTPPVPQTESAIGMVSMNPVIKNASLRAALGSMLARMVSNASVTQAAANTGGIVGMACLARALVSYGRPDVAFDLLSTDGKPSLYYMAQYSGTLWAHWLDSHGNRGKAGSLNHVMDSGSIGEGIFGIGGIQPPTDVLDGEIPSISPIPWLLDAPRGSAVWRSNNGVITTTWASRMAREYWYTWINVTVPSGSSATNIRLMIPPSTNLAEVCAWECGMKENRMDSSVDSQWISFDNNGAGYQKFKASVSSPILPASGIHKCSLIWNSGSNPQASAVGIVSIGWTDAQPGRSLFSAINVVAMSGSYAFYVKSC